MNRYNQTTSLARRPPEVIDVYRPNFVEPGPKPLEPIEQPPMPLAEWTREPVRHNGDAMTQARAVVRLAVAYTIAGGMVTGGLVIVARLAGVVGGSWQMWTFGILATWGAILLGALWANQAMTMRYSGEGTERHRIDKQAEVAHHAIDAHAELLLTRWQIEERGR